MHIAALLTCHNRRPLTLRALGQITSLDDRPRLHLQTVLVDDGSTDGTSEAVRGEFPEVQLLHGEGSLFWCGGMRMAWEHAARSDPDYYLLVNDDTVLEKSALAALLELVGGPDSRRVGVGAIKDPESGRATYGGRRGSRGEKLVEPSGKPERCITFNANLVLIPRAVYRELGVFHHAYTHGLGDFDYGFEATRRGIEVIQTPGFVGSCSHNPIAGTFVDRSLGRAARFRLIRSPKGLPVREWVTYNRRNSGWLWPYRCVAPYLRILLGR